MDDATKARILAVDAKLSQLIQVQTDVFAMFGVDPIDAARTWGRLLAALHQFKDEDFLGYFLVAFNAGLKAQRGG